MSPGVGRRGRRLRGLYQSEGRQPALARLPDVSTSTHPTRTRRPGWLIAILAAAVVVGLIAVLGGLQRREVVAVGVPPGTEIDARNLVFRLDSATVQYLTETTGDPWKVVVSGSVRNPQDETLAPITGRYGNLVAVQEGADPGATGDFYARLGPDNPELYTTARRLVPPTGQWMTLTATYRFAEFPDTGTIEVRVVPMEFTANTILGLNDTPVWNVDSGALPSSVSLPLTRLPDGDY